MRDPSATPPLRSATWVRHLLRLYARIGRIYGSWSLSRPLRYISYGRLIIVDIVYVLIVDAGSLLLIVPGLILFVYLSIAGPVVEIEKHTVRGGFVRSFRLVRGHFWTVAAIVFPIEIVGDAINNAVVGVAHEELGHGLPAAWIGESISNIITAPFFAVAVVLLTLDLIYHLDGTGPVPKRLAAPILTTPRKGPEAA